MTFLFLFSIYIIANQQFIFERIVESSYSKFQMGRIVVVVVFC